MADDLDLRRKRLYFRCWHRGTREADLLLGGFADIHLDGLDPIGLDQLERLLEQPDPSILDWVMMGRPAPAAFDNNLLELIRKASSALDRP